MLQLPTVTLTGLTQVILLGIQVVDFPLAVLTNKSSMVMVAQSGAKTARIQAFSADLLPLDAPSVTIVPESSLIPSGLVSTLEIQVIGKDEKLTETYPQSVTSAATILTSDINSQVIVPTGGGGLAGQNVVLLSDTSPFRLGDTIAIFNGTTGRLVTSICQITAINPNVSITLAVALGSNVAAGFAVTRVPVIMLANGNTPGFPTFLRQISLAGIGTVTLVTPLTNGRTFLFSGVLEVFVAAAGATVSITSALSGFPSVGPLDASAVFKLAFQLSGVPSAGTTVGDTVQLVIAGGAASARANIQVAQI